MLRRRRLARALNRATMGRSCASVVVLLRAGYVAGLRTYKTDCTTTAVLPCISMCFFPARGADGAGRPDATLCHQRDLDATNHPEPGFKLFHVRFFS